ncbi:glyoxalase-like domain-domain-containing protein [Leucosporidium creatinivorum]|uniref:Glyoxalase-like domain-domain-containing protein n=1 Tax=Leucosporidium creatinivorum TaxID=106004 RepID=A0A1Y2FZT3_9BASI|nr:glyoxalase-like domain-domain-containing protein [Leucosporidium creatinivorum]
MAPSSQLDHLILLVPSIARESLDWLSAAGFDLIPGGQHADGLTENVLISLKDGVYLELIAFTAGTGPDKRSAHWWGKKKDGWIDWSLAPAPSTAKARVDGINDASGGAVYDQPVAGGRLNKQGQHVEWEVAFPIVGGDAGERGRRPFWCEDISERGWRVPERLSDQPNGASGISSLILLSAPSQLDRYLSLLAPILAASSSGSFHQYELDHPIGEGKVKVFVREASTDAEKQWVEERGEGLYEVGVSTGKGEKTTIGEAEGARIVFE